MTPKFGWEKADRLILVYFNNLHRKGRCTVFNARPESVTIQQYNMIKQINSIKYIKTTVGT